MSRYASAKLYALPSTLDELHGPTNGAVFLPTRLHWGPDNRYDLAEYLDAGTLLRLCPTLVLPGEARATWGHRFRELRHEVAAA
jgi:hypothetical protein